MTGKRVTGSRSPSRRSVLKGLGAAGVTGVAAPWLAPTTSDAAPAASGVDFAWGRPVRTSRTTPSLQVVVNPLIRRGARIHDHVFHELKNLHADYVRFVPWKPYPRLGVAELEPPTDTSTSWDFSLIDPMVDDFLRATSGHSTIMNFSTIPQWMWKPPWSVVDGQLFANGGGNGTAVDGLKWTDYSFACDVTPLPSATSGGKPYAQAGVLFRMDKDKNGYGFLISNYHYGSAPGYVVFVKITNDSGSAVKNVALPYAIENGKSYHVEVKVSGDTFTAYVDGTPVLTVTDSDHPAGTIGFRENGSESGRFDNVVVTDPSGKVLLKDDFSGGTLDLDTWRPVDDVPKNPNHVDFGYSQGTELAVPVQTVGDYYRRLVQWYTAGGFTDELGTYHRSGHRYDFPYWEVLNELEHGLSPALYTQLYDAIVPEIKKVSPKTKFVGVAEATPGSATYFEYFLDPANHHGDVPIDMISYHFYAHTPPSDSPDTYGATGFPHADTFFGVVDKIEAARMKYAPDVRTTVDETGTIMDAAATQLDPAHIPNAYWNYSGAIYAYVYANLALKGIEVVNESQLVGYPSQYPSVSMVNWRTGLPNARYRVLQLFLQEVPAGVRLVRPPDGQTPDGCYLLGIRDGRTRKVLAVNKTNKTVSVPLTGVRGARSRVVDKSSGSGPIRTDKVRGDVLELGGYAVAVVTVPDVG